MPLPGNGWEGGIYRKEIMYQNYNPNPRGRNVGDCTVRALSKALDQDWTTTYILLSLQGLLMGDMPSSNAVWGAYLRSKGFNRKAIPEELEEYTVNDFANDNPVGTFILALSGHVVCVVDGVLYDSWDSGNEIILYYWERR